MCDVAGDLISHPSGVLECVVCVLEQGVSIKA